MTKLQPYLQRSLWLVFLLSFLLSSLYLSLRILAQADFFYPFWYKVINIEHTIETYGPQNRNKEHFHRTEQAERYRLFAAINHRVFNAGQGLADIHYHDPQGKVIDSLLTADEILHLQDVSKLLSTLATAFMVLCFIMFLSLGMLWRLKSPFPTKKTLMQYLALVTALIAIPLWVFGPEAVFNQLHIWVFPDEHPWFFYYQDSLMSTSMQAPNLFGGIALELLVLAAVIFALGLTFIKRRLTP